MELTPSITAELLDRLNELLGADAFFVPCEWGTKKPLVTYVERPFEGTKTEAYRALLPSSQPTWRFTWARLSGGLCAIDFDKDEDLAAFLAVNPKLAGTCSQREPRRYAVGADHLGISRKL